MAAGFDLAVCGQLFLLYIYIYISFDRDASLFSFLVPLVLILLILLAEKSVCNISLISFRLVVICVVCPYFYLISSLISFLYIVDVCFFFFLFFHFKIF